MTIAHTLARGLAAVLVLAFLLPGAAMAMSVGLPQGTLING